MKYTTILLCLFLSIASSTAQEKRLISYDLKNGKIDTLLLDFDKNILADNTDFYIGNYSKIFSPLETDIKQGVLPPYADALFTYKQQVADYYNLDEFPIRTSIQLMRISNGELSIRCSGSIVSPKHVLTACHCMFDYKDSLLYDSLLVAPIFDKSEFSSKFKSSKVVKIYKFERWTSSDDFALLELEEPIGLQTGWLGIGFDNEMKVFEDGLFYKFSYPGKTMPKIDPRVYNGDTIYFNYGHLNLNYIQDNSIKIRYLDGILGESGSSLILVENENTYTTYGTLSFSYNLNHARIQNHVFYGFKSIMDPYLNNSSLRETTWDIKANFNTSSNILSYELPTEQNISIQVFNMQGMQQYDNRVLKTTFGEIDLSELQSGVHVLIISSDNAKFSKKIIKR